MVLCYSDFILNDIYSQTVKSLYSPSLLNIPYKINQNKKVGAINNKLSEEHSIGQDTLVLQAVRLAMLFKFYLESTVVNTLNR